jgi:hypothetical protein
MTPSVRMLAIGRPRCLPPAGPRPRRRHAVTLTLAFALLSGAVSPLQAYLTFGATTAEGRVTLRWNRLPVRYFVTDRDAPGITAGDLQRSVDRSFMTWQNVTTATVSFQDVGFTSAPPFREDGVSTLGFEARPDLDRVLGATSFVIDTTTGDIVEADVFFNTTFAWSVSAAGEPGRYDLESIATHEIGHLLGLGHSALGETEVRPVGRRVIAAEAAMFPIAYSAGSIDGRRLRADDIAGVSVVYPEPGFTGDTGGISGRVTKDGRGVFGAHVVAFNTQTGTLVGCFSLAAEGTFGLAGLDPGVYVLRVEPLDDAEVSSYFDADATAVDLAFRVTYLDRLVIVPRGGAGPPVEVKVVAR